MKPENKLVIYLLLFSGLFLAVSCNSTDYNKNKSIHYITNSFEELIRFFKDDVAFPKECTERLDALRRHNAINYMYYDVSVERLNNSLIFYKENRNYMTEDAKTVYFNQIRTKIDLLCSRIESEYYKL